MIKILTATNNPNLNEELKKEKGVEIVCKDIQYKEGILEILENVIEVDYIIIEEKLPGEIKLTELINKIYEKNEKIKIIITIKRNNKKSDNLENNKIIKIFYDNKIDLNKLKNYKNNLYEKSKTSNFKKIKKLKNKFNTLKNINIIKVIKKLKIKKLKIKK